MGFDASGSSLCEFCSEAGLLGRKNMEIATSTRFEVQTIRATEWLEFHDGELNAEYGVLLNVPSVDEIN